MESSSSSPCSATLRLLARRLPIDHGSLCGRQLEVPSGCACELCAFHVGVRQRATSKHRTPQVSAPQHSSAKTAALNVEGRKSARDASAAREPFRSAFDLRRADSISLQPSLRGEPVKKTRGKLALSRETLRHLQARSLRVVGGIPTDGPIPESITCECIDTWAVNCSDYPSNSDCWSCIPRI